MSTSNKNWLITGCSSGLGRAFAQEVLKKGFNAVITARNPKDIQDIVEDYPKTSLPLALDVTKKEQIKRVIEQAEAKFGTIDVLVNNAGHGYRAAVEEGDENRVEELFNTNFFGTVDMIKAVLPGMRKQKSGTIFNVSSIAGRYSNPGSGYYSATKFAVEGMSDALSKEVAPLGIRVIVVEPGAFRTDFAGRSLMGTTTEISDYKETAGKRRKENDHTHGTQPGNPKKAAQVIIKIAESEVTPFRLLLGTDAIQLTRSELEHQIKELDDWRTISSSTDY
ncbi:short-chain dehydrogenase/reductase [Labilibaculum manganireducens]|uniref:Short-chain dehydrogenase/reductase n=1 Tax=Labilibaculum manganireducens TaxID=1940525 RepID=A0A2N3I8N1_9BACT|nr:oxidoreductase [Labilibaculum manganireducens]PKQ66681.1 short-chain dehydrogenase/reductase [Labilibaculum manganireducens]